jgi:hypothetical protein
MILSTSYAPLEVFWTLLIFFGFVVWLWILSPVLADIFRRHDISGWVKVLWIVFIVVIPLLDVFIYLITEHEGMTERTLRQQQAAQTQVDDYVRSVAAQSDPAEQIAKGQAAARQRRNHAGRSSITSRRKRSRIARTRQALALSVGRNAVRLRRGARRAITARRRRRRFVRCWTRSSARLVQAAGCGGARHAVGKFRPTFDFRG